MSTCGATESREHLKGSRSEDEVVMSKRLGLILAAFIVLGGGLLIWLLMPPALFTSSVYLHVIFPTVGPASDMSLAPGYQEYMARKVAQVTSDEVIKNALSDPSWLACKKDSPQDEERFRSRLKMRPRRRGAPIWVEFSDEDPECARIGLEAFTRAFLAAAKEPMSQEDIEFDQEVRDLKAKIAEAESRLEANEDPEVQRECERMNYQLGNLVTSRPWKPRFVMVASPVTSKQ